jgi:8-oxo-dGTP pyrophosphatase MutT (NUDIX family)
MPHIHEKIDFTVGAYIVFQNKVLLVFHKKLQKWLPVGGHIELDEDPEEALFREIEEETGIKKDQLEMSGKKPDLISEGTKFLTTPDFLDIHRISDTHKHVGMFYFLKSTTNNVKLEEHAHEDIRWLEEKDLDDTSYNLTAAVKFYAREALKVSK